MTREEFIRYTSEARLLRDHDMQAVVDFVRTLPPVLRDAGREHSAKALDELLFIFDAHQQDLTAWMRANRDEILEIILGLGKGNL